MSVYQKIDVLTGLNMLKDLAIGHPKKAKTRLWYLSQLKSDLFRW